MKKLLYSILFVSVLLAATAFPVGAASMSFYVTSVEPNDTVSVHTQGFPEGTNLSVTMGPAGSAGLGYYVTTTYTGEGGVLDRTFSIPAALNGMGTIVLRFESADGEYVAYGPFTNQAGGTSKPASGSAPASGSSTSSTGLELYVQSVAPDEDVSVRTGNFPAGTFFNVYMGKHGTNGVNGVLVARTNSGDGGSFGVVYTIPSQLYGQSIIDLRMVSDDGSSYAAVSFYNSEGGGAAPSTSSGSSSTSSGSGSYVSYVPTFSIVTVKPGESVTIRTYNFPPAQAFTVRMGPYGTYGINGEIVGTTDSGNGGSFEATYSIPASLKSADAIAIRMDSSQGYYAYNWFTNMGTSSAAPTTVPPVAAATPVPGAPAAPPAQPPITYTGFPYFYINSVVANNTVTITGYNFPPDQSYVVTMGPYGGYGIGGTVVATSETKTGGTITATYTIPANLAGSYQIAIRIESPYNYAYNWFYNVTAP
jgi:hypothetical protein